MRICYLSTDRGIAFGGTKGAAIHVGQMVDALAEEGTQVLVLVAEVAPGAVSRPGAVIEELPRSGARGWIAERLSEFRPDALYERLALHTDLGARVARALGIPHIVELNAPLLEEAVRYRSLDEPERADQLERATLSAANIVLAVSPPLADYARQRGARRVEVAQNAAALDAFSPSLQRNDPPVAVFAGSLRPWHGLETIADAWRMLATAAPPLLVVGDGPKREALVSVATRMVGSVAPGVVPTLLASADIGLAPYGRDTPRYFSPIKLFEYLAAGLAVVVGDLPAVTSVVGRETAVIIPAGDAHALADAVARLQSDREERLRLGRAGRALIATQHTWRHRARRVMALVRELSSVGDDALARVSA